MSSAFFLQLAVGAIIPVLPLFAKSIGLTANGVGLIVSAPSLAKLLLNLPMGHVADTIGRKPPLIVGTLVEAVGSFLTAWSSTLSQLVPARLLVGAGSSAGTSAGAAYTMDVVGRFPEHTGLLLGTAQAVGMLAFAGGPMLGGLLAERGGAALPFTFIGIVLLASAPLFCLLPETLHPASVKGGGGGKGVGAAASVGLREALSASLASFALLLADRTQRGLLLMRAALFTGWSASLTVVPLHATAAWGATAGQLGQMYSIITIVGLLSAPAAGLLTDRVGRHPLMLAGSISTALSIAALPLARSQRAYYALMAVWSIGEGFLMTATAALSADVTPPEQRGAQTSMLSQTGDFTFLLMPLVLGALAASRGAAAAFLSTSAIVLAANAGFWMLTRA